MLGLDSISAIVKHVWKEIVELYRESHVADVVVKTGVYRNPPEPRGKKSAAQKNLERQQCRDEREARRIRPNMK